MSTSKPNKGNILIVDGQPANQEALTAMLTEGGYHVQSTNSGQLALEAARKSPPDLILLHIHMPDMDGYEICERLKADEGTGDIPLILFSALDKAQDRGGIFAAGGADYVTTPFQRDEVLARVETHLALRATGKQLAEKDAQVGHEITKLMLAQEALRESEEKYRTLVENISDVIYAVNQDGVLTYVSPAIEPFIGYSPPEVIGRHLKEFIYQEDLPRLTQSFQRVLAGRNAAGEYRVLTKSGEMRWMRASGQPTSVGDRVTGVQGALTDITGHKQAEEALQELTHDLGERVKELNCLYGLSKLSRRQDISLEDIFRGTVDLIPPAFQHPDITCARIIHDGQEFRTRNFKESIWGLATDLTVHGTRVGTLEVTYLEDRPEHYEGFFLKEERNLVDAVAERLGRITERKQAEEQIRQQNEFLTTILDSLTHPFYVVDANDYTVQIANAASGADGLSGHVTCYALTHGRSKPCATASHPCPLEEIKSTKKPLTVEHVHHDQDGSARNFEVYGYPLYDGAGNVVQIIEYSLDITERKQAEEALRESEARWRSITENSPDHVLLLDTDLNIEFVNYASAGLAVEELLGTPLYTYVSPQRQSEIKEILENVLQTAEPAGYETEYSAPDGSTIYYESRVVPRILDDQVIGLAVNARDVTEHKRTEKALHEEGDRAQNYLDIAGVIMLVVDAQQKIVLINRKGCEILGYEEVEIVGRNWFDSFVPQQDRDRVKVAFAELMAGQIAPVEYFENAVLAKSGEERIIAWHNTLLTDEAGNIVGALSSGEDITERKRTEQALREAKEAAEEARREEEERRQEAERRRQIAESLADVLAALNSNQPLNKVLDHIATQARQLLGNQAVAICSLPGEAETLVVQAAQGLPVDDVAAADIPFGHEALRQAMASRQPVAVSAVSATLSDDSARSLDAGQSASVASWVELCRALLAVPIVVKEEIYGGMVLYYAQPRTFSDDEVELAAVFGDQIALAIENARLRDQIEKTAAMAERSRLARDLHDSVTQALFSATLVAEVLPQVWRRDPDEAEQGLEELRHLTRSALAEMRTLLLELRPTALVETKLADLLRQLTEAVTSRARILVALNIESIPTLPPDVHVTFYRVAQEALHNAVKHAEASQVTVSLCTLPPTSARAADDWPGQVRLCVSDDGQGFDPSHTEPDQLGLGIMRERAETIGARLTIESQPGQGTQVTLIWPNT